MGKSTSNNDDNIILSLSDFKRICKKWKKTIAKGAFIVAALLLSLSLLKPLKYVSEATFYEKAKNDSVSGNTKNAALLLLGEEKESSALVMLKSHKVIEAAVEKLSLQATVEPYSVLPRLASKLLKYLSHPPKNLLVEKAHLTRSSYPVIIDPTPDFRVEGLKYHGEVPLYFDVKFTSEDSYIVNDSLRGFIGEGQLEQPFIAHDVSFTLHANNTVDLHERRYEIIIQPLRKVADMIAGNLKVVADYKDKSFLTLSLSYNSRYGTSTLLNTIMESYRDYLLQDHHRVVASQVDYLKQRRGHMEKELAIMMHDHAEQMSAHAGNLEILVATQQNLQKKLLTIDLEIKHIERSLNEGSYVKAEYISENDPPFVHQTVAEMRRHRQQSNAIALALRDLKNENRTPITNVSSQEFQGIDLETANALYLSCCKEVQEAEASAIQNQFILSKIAQPNFELSSLAGILNDPISGEIVKKAGNLTLAMQDQSNRTERELDRLNQDLILQRNFLSTHLHHVTELLGIRIDHLYSKLQGIQEASLSLIKQKISLYEKQLLDYATSRLNTLKQERTLIQHQKQALQQEFDKLPEQWATEKLLDLYLKTDGTLMEHIGGLIESKNIADHLEISLSAPFDKAIPSLHPKSPFLLIFTLFGAIAGALGVMAFALAQSALRGIDATDKNLRLAGATVAGTIGYDGTTADDRETLRHLATELYSRTIGPTVVPNGQTLLLLEGQGPHYGNEFATMLSKRKLKVMLIEISLNEALSLSSSTNDGLLSYLEGKIEAPKIIKGEYDQILMGGKTNYVLEMLESERFSRLLMGLRSDYDWVIAVSRAPIGSAEAKGALSHFESIAVTVNNVKLQELTPLLKLPQHCIFLIAATA